MGKVAKGEFTILVPPQKPEKKDKEEEINDFPTPPTPENTEEWPPKDEEPEEPKKPKKGKDKDGDQDGDQDGDGDKEFSDEEKEQIKEIIARVSEITEGEQGEELEGAGVGGILTPEQAEELLKEADIDVELPNEEEIIRTARTAVESSGIQKSSGSGKGLLAKAVLALVKPQVNWKDLLKRYIGKALTSDPEYYIGNRRFISGGDYLTGERGSETGLDGCLMAVDTSGSVSNEELAVFLSEMKSLVQQKRIKRTTVIYFDDGIQYISDLKSVDKVKKYTPPARSHGGTSYVEPLKKMMELWKKGQYNLAIFFTDSDRHALSQIANTPPKFRNKWIWVIYNDTTWKSPWGDKVVHVSTKDIESLKK